MRSPKEVILFGLSAVRGDDLERAQAAWGHLPDAELDREHGEEWQDGRREVESAIRYAEKLP